VTFCSSDETFWRATFDRLAGNREMERRSVVEDGPGTGFCSRQLLEGSAGSLSLIQKGWMSGFGCSTPGKALLCFKES